jgi:transcription elongation GreA/GreB family factor
MDEIYLSSAKLAAIKAEYTELKASLDKENEEFTLRGGPMDSVKEAAAFSVSLAAKKSLVGEMEGILAKAKVLPDEIPGDKVVLGKWFSVKSPTAETKYRLVHQLEADPSKNLVSANSPLGKSVLNLTTGKRFSLNGLRFSVSKVW